MASCKSISNHMWARTCCGNPDAMKILFTSSPTKWKKKKRRNMLHNLYDLVYNCAVCENNPITPTVQPRGRWPTYTHKRHAFFVFRSRKKARIKERVLFNAFSLLCSALFWKIKVSCFKMALPKYQINISISQQVSLYNC